MRVLGVRVRCQKRNVHSHDLSSINELLGIAHSKLVSGFSWMSRHRETTFGFSSPLNDSVTQRRATKRQHAKTRWRIELRMDTGSNVQRGARIRVNQPRDDPFVRQHGRFRVPMAAR